MKINIKKMLNPVQFKFLLLIYTAILLSISPKEIYAIAYLETTIDIIDVSYNAHLDDSAEISETQSRENSVSIVSEFRETESENNNLHIPLSIIVNNELKSYQLSINQITPFENENIKIEMNYPSFISDSGNQRDPAENLSPFKEFLLMNPLKINLQELLFFTHENPEYSTQTFDFLFNVNVLEEIKPGSYSSIIKFYLYQEGIVVSEIEITFNVLIEKYFIMEVVFIDSQKATFDFGFVSKEITRIDKQIEINIISNIEKPYKILQKRGENMKSSLTDLEFYLEDILFEVDSNDLKGKAYYDKTKSLEIEDDVIYESDSIGSSDTIPVTYSLQNHGHFKAGDYESTFSFYIETIDKTVVFSDINVIFDFYVNIEQYFFFNVYPENNNSILDFTPRMLETSAKSKTLKVEVSSNTGKPYTFSHSLPNELVNTNGGILDNKDITFLLVNNEGEPLLLEEEKLINKEEQIIYESNALGDSDLFYIKYKTSVDKTQTAGLYRSDIQYSLSDD